MNLVKQYSKTSNASMCMACENMPASSLAFIEACWSAKILAAIPSSTAEFSNTSNSVTSASGNTAVFMQAMHPFQTYMQ